jgi:DNA-binding XRE family transcriptional regulator
VAEPASNPGIDPIEVMPVVVLSQVFPARPSSIPEIRDFVRHCLAESPLTEEGAREVGETVFRALLDAAGPTGYIQVAFRIFPEHVEVDVLHSAMQIPAQLMRPASPAISAAPPLLPQPTGPVPGSQAARAAEAAAQAAGSAAQAAYHDGPAVAPVPQAADQPAAGEIAAPDDPDTFAEWMSQTLRREGLTQEAAARQLGVSVKTVSRWVGGATEPRMRDLRRIQEVFGETPLR